MLLKLGCEEPWVPVNNVNRRAGRIQWHGFPSSFPKEDSWEKSQISRVCWNIFMSSACCSEIPQPFSLIDGQAPLFPVCEGGKEKTWKAKTLCREMFEVLSAITVAISSRKQQLLDFLLYLFLCPV